MRDLLRDLPGWDRASKLSLLLALLILLLLLWLGFAGPPELRFPARIGAFATLLTLQLLFFWGNRRRISPYHQAQRSYMEGDYTQARDILEQLPGGERVSVDALILLAHASRQLCQFKQSRAAINRALELRPDYHYALYAAGKLSLVTGDYAEASRLLETAKENGAPDVILFELGQACFLGGDATQAKGHFSRFLAFKSDEAAKITLSRFYLRRMGDGTMPAEAEIEAHLAYWIDEAERYQTTEYGFALKRDIDELRSILRRVPL